MGRFPRRWLLVGIEACNGPCNVCRPVIVELPCSCSFASCSLILLMLFILIMPGIDSGKGRYLMWQCSVDRQLVKNREHLTIPSCEGQNVKYQIKHRTTNESTSTSGFLFLNDSTEWTRDLESCSLESMESIALKRSATSFYSDS
jgi:hypothetical protein